MFTFTDGTDPDPTDPTHILIAGDSLIMAEKIASAINTGRVRIDAVAIGQTGIVALTNRQPSKTGNQPTTHAIASSTASFFISPMLTGGLAGDCGNGTGCAQDADCFSNHCDTATHQCVACADDFDCTTGICYRGQCQVCLTDIQCPVLTLCNLRSGTCE
jgi:hypothetical protein